MDDAGTGNEPGHPRKGSDGTSILVGSFRRVLAESDSRLLRSYAVVSALVGTLLALLLVLALPVWIFNTVRGSELATFSRAFLVVGGVVLLGVLVAPVVSAGRRRAGESATGRIDVLLGLSGYLFVLSLYIGLLISAPPGQREAPPALLAPVVEFLYGLPQSYGIVPPVLAAVLIGVVHWFSR